MEDDRCGAYLLERRCRGSGRDACRFVVDMVDGGLDGEGRGAGGAWTKDVGFSAVEEGEVHVRYDYRLGQRIIVVQRKL